MSGARSKRKGSAFENVIAKMLNEIHETEEFARTPGSGAWMGRSNASKRSGVAQAAQETLRGDLITPSDYPFIIECKSYGDAPAYHNLIQGAERHVDKWLKEVEFDAEQAGKLPMLWFKTVRKGTYFVVPKCAYQPELLRDMPYFVNYRDYVIFHESEYQRSLEYILPFNQS